MTAFEDLLLLQQHDTTADQLRHRLSALPERVRLEENRREAEAHTVVTAAVQASRDELGKEQRRIEDDVAGIVAKATQVDRTLYGGSVRSPRELQDLQEDLASLARRQRQLEDQVLEVMEKIEPLDNELAERDAKRVELARLGAELDAATVEAEASTQTELAQVESERATIVPGIPGDLLAHYDELRSRFGGVAVARLVGSSCGGCHLTLPAVELDHIRHEAPDTWVHCEECGRLLVR